MIQIEIQNEQTSCELDLDWLETQILAVLNHLQIRSAELSVILIDHPTMHEWNRRIMNHDYPTDVITIPLHEPSTSGVVQHVEGELFISVEMARDLAEELDWSLDYETLLYAIHGILHLTGLDDQTEADQLQMRKAERDVLKVLEIETRPRDDRWKLY